MIYDIEARLLLTTYFNSSISAKSEEEAKDIFNDEVLEYTWKHGLNLSEYNIETIEENE